jgi:hypothetical protein
MTLPLPPISLPIFSPARRPPSRLLDWTLDTAMLVSARSPSIVMTLIPASCAAFSGGIIAFGSVWEIMIASGFFATTALTTAVCLATVELRRALHREVDVVLGRHRLRAAGDRRVERVPGQAGDVDDLGLLAAAAAAARRGAAARVVAAAADSDHRGGDDHRRHRHPCTLHCCLLVVRRARGSGA